MPKQGRRWTIEACTEDLPLDGVLVGPTVRASHPDDPDQPVEVMPTQEHVAVLEGLAEKWEAEAKHLEEDAGLANTTRPTFASSFFRELAKEVRNLIEQGGAGK